MQKSTVNKTIATATLSVAAALALSACAGGSADVRPSLAIHPSETAYLPRSHSHNNYDQRRPLVDALERGFASIEVDVVLAEGELYVAHAPEEVEPSRTLRALYLEPLSEIVSGNGGSVYGPDAPPLQLLVDVKTDAAATYDALHDVLSGYSDMLTVWTDGVADARAVSVVISGNRATALIREAPVRYAAIDGRILDDRAGMTPDAMPLVSADWETLGPPVREDRLARARAVVAQMHEEGRKVRFWATPEDEALWRSLLVLGVDYIGTDDTARLERTLRDFDREASASAVD